MKISKHIFRPVFFCIFLCFFIAANLAIKESRNKLSAHYELNIIDIPPKAIRLISGEFNGLMSDFLLMQICSFTGSGKKISQAEWDRVLLGYNQVMDLDPYFEQTFLEAQASIAWDAKMPKDAINLIDISRESRFWDFRPGFYMGFDYYYFLGDYASASKIFLATSNVVNCPVLIPLLGTRFAAKSERVETSILILENMLTQQDVSVSSKMEIANRITALQGVSVLEKAVKKYKEQFGQVPQQLDMLVEKGIIKQMPENPYPHQSYSYDPVNDEVRFDDVKSDVRK